MRIIISFYISVLAVSIFSQTDVSAPTWQTPESIQDSTVFKPKLGKQIKLQGGAALLFLECINYGTDIQFKLKSIWRKAVAPYGGAELAYYKSIGGGGPELETERWLASALLAGVALGRRMVICRFELAGGPQARLNQISIVPYPRASIGLDIGDHRFIALAIDINYYVFFIGASAGLNLTF